MKETIVRINKSKSWFFEKINKIDKHLARLRDYKRQCRNTNIIRDHYEQLYGNKMDNLEEMNRFL